MRGHTGDSDGISKGGASNNPNRTGKNLTRGQLQWAGIGGKINSLAVMDLSHGQRITGARRVRV